MPEFEWDDPLCRADWMAVSQWCLRKVDVKTHACKHIDAAKNPEEENPYHFHPPDSDNRRPLETVHYESIKPDLAELKCLWVQEDWLGNKECNASTPQLCKKTKNIIYVGSSCREMKPDCTIRQVKLANWSKEKTKSKAKEESHPQR